MCKLNSYGQTKVALLVKELVDLHANVNKKTCNSKLDNWKCKDLQWNAADSGMEAGTNAVQTYEVAKHVLHFWVREFPCFKT